MTDNQRFTQELPVMLTAAELRDRSAELAAQLHVVDELEMQAKQDAADAKQRIGKAKRRVSELGDIVRNRAEPRDVECVREHDYARGEVVTYRADSGERVSSRPLSLGERQQALAVVPHEVAPSTSTAETVEIEFVDETVDEAVDTQSVGITREPPPDDFEQFS